jgi:hypothetical protein
VSYSPTNTETFNLSEAVSQLATGLADSSTNVKQRLVQAAKYLGCLDTVYEDIVTSTEDSRTVLVTLASRIFELYRDTIGLLPPAANLGLAHSTRLNVLGGLNVLCCTAIMQSIRLGHISDAVEALEEGRGLFWSQTLRLR